MQYAFDLSSQPLIETIEGRENYNAVPEIEVKFMKKGSGRSGVPRGVKESVEEMLSESYTSIDIINTDIFNNGERYTVLPDGSMRITTKERLSEDIYEGLTYDLKLSVNAEKDIEVSAQSLYLNNNPDRPYSRLSRSARREWEDKAGAILGDRNGESRRRKDRRSFRINRSASADLTFVTTTKVGTSYSTWEIEVEYMGDVTDYGITLFQEAIEEVSRYVEMSYVIHDYNRWVTMDSEYVGTNFKFLTARASTQPRNFKPADFVIGGLIGGPVEYSVTVKSDGIRRNVVVHETGIWLVKPKRGFPVMDKIGPTLPDNRPFIGTVIDGEWNETDNVFTPFDCISFQGSSKMQSIDHIKGDSPKSHTRMLLARKVCATITAITIDYKKFYMIGSDWKTMEYALRRVQEYHDERITGGELLDGYIFTPNNYRYKTILSKDEKIYGKDRSLKDTPDILKLKPWNMLTIDFIVKSSDFHAYSFNRNRQMIEIFKGTKLTPFTEDNLDMNNMVYDKIVELGPISKPGETVVLGYVRTRGDKDTPNMTTVAESVWKDLHQPISIESLRGTDFKFLRLYFNQIKSIMINGWSLGGVTVVDIGSGKGSDLNKWDKYGVTHILAIEPNEENLTEFRRRLGQMDVSKTKSIRDILTLNVGGEATFEIVRAFRTMDPPESNTLIISSMLSLSFFWSSQSMLKGLARTLVAMYLANGKRRTVFSFFTIEKERTLSVFKRMGSNEIQLGPGSLKVSPGGIVDIHLPGTIVGEQREYLVDIQVLHKYVEVLMKGTPIETKVMDLVTSDFILSDEEKIFASMYVTGEIVMLPG